MVDEEHSLSGYDAIMGMRMAAYKILSRIFLEQPTRVFLDKIRKSQMFDYFPFREEHSLIRQGIAMADKYLETGDLSDAERIKNLHTDYMRLFIGPGEILAPPWESVYLDPERLMFQEETLQVRRMYLKYCLAAPDAGCAAEDHLGYELDFMYQLCQLNLREQFEERCKIFTDQKEFLDGHLLRWVPMICEDIRSYAKTDFYRGIAMVLEGFVEVDQRAVDELLNAMKCS